MIMKNMVKDQDYIDSIIIGNSADSNEENYQKCM